MKNRIAVYTCITGDYDNLHEIKDKEKGIDYYCFTNNKKIKSNTWNVVYIQDKKLTNVELARKIKILGHRIINDYDILLWMDGAVEFKKKIKDFISKYLKKDDIFVAFKHGERKTVKEEIIACYKHGKEKKEKIKKIMKFYNNVDYPDNNELIESTVYIKRPKEKVVKETMKLWFEMILLYSHRDQLSFNYCAYKTNMKIKWINKKVFNNEWFSWENHDIKRKISRYKIYFGNEQLYSMDNDIQGEYIIKDNIYSFEATSPCDCNEATIMIETTPCIQFDNMIINKKSLSMHIYNYIDIDNKKIFYNEFPVVKLEGNIKKGDIIMFSCWMRPLTYNNIYDFVSKVSEDLIITREEKKGLLLRFDHINKKIEERRSRIIINQLLSNKAAFANSFMIILILLLILIILVILLII